MFIFFFFQAEDGIRDGRVTGVQTCALPISGDDEAARRAELVPPRLAAVAPTPRARGAVDGPGGATGSRSGIALHDPGRGSTRPGSLQSSPEEPGCRVRTRGLPARLRSPRVVALRPRAPNKWGEHAAWQRNATRAASPRRGFGRCPDKKSASRRATPYRARGN